MKKYVLPLITTLGLYFGAANVEKAPFPYAHSSLENQILRTDDKSSLENLEEKYLKAIPYVFSATAVLLIATGVYASNKIIEDYLKDLKNKEEQYKK